MDLPYEVTGFLGYGANGSVYRASYEGAEVALKFQYGLRHDHEFLVEQCRTEYEHLVRLGDVAGVPNPILMLDELNGTYEELGLALSGVPISRVVSIDRYWEDEKRDIFFSGAFLFELINGRRLSFENKQQKSFFEKLEEMVHQIHEGGLSLPNDLSAVLEANGEPYILDWLCVDDLITPSYFQDSPNPIDRTIQFDLATVRCFRERFQLS